MQPLSKAFLHLKGEKKKNLYSSLSLCSLHKQVLLSELFTLQLFLQCNIPHFRFLSQTLNFFRMV